MRWAPFCMATSNGGQWQDLMLHQISQRNEDTLSRARVSGNAREID